jgi:predicted outer membrane protein
MFVDCHVACSTSEFMMGPFLHKFAWQSAISCISVRETAGEYWVLNSCRMACEMQIKCCSISLQSLAVARQARCAERKFSVQREKKMSIIKYTALVLTLASCNFAFAQQQADQTRRSERVGERRDQLSENREERQENRGARQAERSRDGRELTIGINNNSDNSLDQFIASCLLIGNQEEVALAQVAVDRAENENVKQFAQMLVDDHQKTIQKLQQHAKQGVGLDSEPTLSAASGVRSGQSDSNLSPTAQQYTANRADLDRDSASNGALDQVLKMQQQAAQECLSMTKAMMQEKQGAEFDKAFAGSQIGAHVGMLAKLKASEQHVSSELAPIIQESQQTVQMHLEQAKQLCEELEGMQASNR